MSPFEVVAIVVLVLAGVAVAGISLCAVLDVISQAYRH